MLCSQGHKSLELFQESHTDMTTLRSIVRKGNTSPHHMFLLKNNQKAFPEVARSFLLSHLTELYHTSIVTLFS